MEIPGTHATEAIPTETAAGGSAASDFNSLTLDVVSTEPSFEQGSDTSGEARYEFLVKGEVTGVPQVSSSEEIHCRELSASTEIVSGYINDSPQTFTLSGEIIAFDCDNPTTTVRVDGTERKPEYWPRISDCVSEYSLNQPVADPFTQTGILGSSPNDPLDPEKYTITLHADDQGDPSEYRFSFDGEILSVPEGAAVTDGGMDVSGQTDGEMEISGSIEPGDTATIQFRGLVTEIDPDNGVEFEITQS